MRWSKLMLSFGILSTFSLIGCRQQSSSDALINQQKPADSRQESNHLDQTMQPRPVTPHSTDEGNKIAVGTAKQCYAELCEANHELKLLDLMENAKKGSAEQRKYYKKYIDPMVLQAMKLRAEAQRTSAKLLKKYNDRFENIKLTEVQRRLFTSMYYLMKPAVLNPEDRARIDQALSKTAVMKARRASMMKDASAYFAAIHPEVDIQKSAQMEAVHIRTLQKKFTEATEFKLNAGDSPASARAFKGETLSRDDLNTIYSKATYLRSLDALVFREAQAAIDKLGYSELEFYDTIKRAKLSQRFANIKDFSAVDSGKCEQAFYQSINLAPKKNEIARFEILKEQVKKASLSLLSPEDPAYAVVQKIDFYLPYDSEENARVWTEGFNEDVAFSKAEIARVSQYEATESYILALANALSPPGDVGLCDNLYDPSLIDSITPEDGASRLSWMTVRYPRYGISILAHEINHVVYKHSKRFQPQIACITEQNGTEKYTAEDFADLMAIKTEKILGDFGVDMADKKGNLGCLFASSRIGEGLDNTTPEDSHSSHLFRAVKFALYRQQDIPMSCKTLARLTKPSVMNSCDY